MKSVLILIAVFFAVRALKKRFEGAGASEAPRQQEPSASRDYAAPVSRQAAEEMVLDPICGHYVPISAAIVSTSGGKSVYFCSEECRERYAH